jgi:threonine aldolase
MAARIASGLDSLPGLHLVHLVQANEVFVALPEAWVTYLEAVGFEFYRWPARTDAMGTAIRLVTSYTTRAQDVDNLIAALREAAAQE